MPNLIERIFNSNREKSNLTLKIDSEGLNIIFPHDFIEKADQYFSKLSDLELLQLNTLRGLCEEGLASEFPNGFVIASNEAISLDIETRQILDLPTTWPGEFELVFNGKQTYDPDFEARLILVTCAGNKVSNYRVNGPLLKLTREEQYLPNQLQWEVIQAFEHHRNLNPYEKDEYENLLLIHRLQDAKANGLKIDLHHFNDLNVDAPDSIGVVIEENPDGSLQLSPGIAKDLNLDLLKSRLHQLDPDRKVKSLRIKDRFFVFNNKQLEALHEIIENRTIHKDQIQTFLKEPGAYLNSQMIDLDLGFSLRVKGAEIFQHAYFGDTDASNLEWFGKNGSDISSVLKPANSLKNIITTEEDLQEIKHKINAARQLGADHIKHEGQLIDISDIEETEKTLAALENKFKQDIYPDKDTASKPIDSSSEIAVVSINTNDTKLEIDTSNYGQQNNIIFEGELDFDNLKRTPFTHQEFGIRWLYQQYQEALKYKPEEIKKGAILADDMGLGKTFTALASIDQLYKLASKNGQERRPVLVVCPVSLIENWVDEVYKTFHENPFTNGIIKLHTNADLGRFKQPGSKSETKQEQDNNGQINTIRHALKFGPKCGNKALDIPERLVITNYQTLRDYQFSLCRIDWGLVIFDEAQEIKNPNTIASRAAKGLKSQFKLITTGTPVENSLKDYWCLMDTVKPGQLSSWQEFRKKYILPIKNASTPEAVFQARFEVGQDLEKDSDNYLLRRTKEDHLKELPKKRLFVGYKTENKSAEYTECLHRQMVGDQLNAYNRILLNYQRLRNESDLRGQALGMLQNLKNVTLHPQQAPDPCLLPSNKNELQDALSISGKIDMLIIILEKIKKREEKAIIFLINKNIQRLLAAALSKLYGIKVDCINGDTKAVENTNKANKTRRAIIKDFENKKGFNVIIMSPIAAGVGLTIVGANNVIHLERHWNPAKEAQATDRVYRIGQKKDVNVYYPILSHPEINSFDINLDKLLNRKVGLQKTIATIDDVNQRELMASCAIAGTFEVEDSEIHYDDVIGMDERLFESFCGVLIAKRYDGNYECTPQSGDHGADVIVTGKKNILIECKHYNSKRKWNEYIPVEHLSAAKNHYEHQLDIHFDKMFLITLSKTYSRRVINVAEIQHVELIGRKEIITYLDEHPVKWSDLPPV